MNGNSARGRFLALAVAALTAASVAAASQAQASGPAHRVGAVSPAQAKKVAAVRAEQARMKAALKVTPQPRTAGSTTFTVNTTEDSDLANPTGTSCVDAADGKCSLRAAVDAANNRNTPVQVLLSNKTYLLTSATALSVTDPAGLTIVGKGASATTISGDGSGILSVSAAAAGDPSAVLFLRGVTLTGGTATDGGAVYLGDSSAGAVAVLDNDVITANSASGYGGGIYAGDYDTLYMTNTKVTHNAAPYGGGIYGYWLDGKFVHCTMDANSTTASATGYGGGIYGEYGVLEFDGGSISGNSAGDASDTGYGGAGYDYYAEFDLNGVTVDGNTAADGGEGGGFYIEFAVLDVTKGSVSHNTTSGTNGQGGGIYAYEGAQVGLHGVTMAADKVSGTNTEGNGGGAIYVYGYYYGTQLIVDSGTKITGANNAAVYLYAYEGQIDATIAKSTLSGNRDGSLNGYNTSGCGGAVCAYSYEYGSINLAMTNDTVSGNSSGGTYSAGAVTVWDYYYSTASVALRNDKFSGNHSGANGYGGAVGLLNFADDASPISAQLSSNTFTGNYAGTSASPGYGGALATYYYVALSDVGSTFSGNKAVGSGAEGGAVLDYNYQSATFSGTKFLNNSAGGSSDTSGSGGAVYTDDEAADRFTGVTMSGNTASSYGGAVYADTDAFDLVFRNSTVSGNTAGTASTAGSGGGIYAGDAVLALENSTVSGNKATGSTGTGGGIWHSGSSLGLRYTTVSGNSAASGGGVYADGEGGTLLASIVSGNHKKPGGPEQDCTTPNTSSSLSSLGGNVLGQAACVVATAAKDKITTHPGLKSLAANGGPTKTMALTATSPAIDRGGYMCPSTDQRGEPRNAAHCDAGAYERAPGKVTSVQPNKAKAGHAVTIKGSGFLFARSVTFGSKHATFHVVNDSTITTHAPKGQSGTVVVKVTTPDGAGTTGHFTYA